MMNNWITYSPREESFLPDDVENSDKKELAKLIESYMNEKYTPIQNDLVHTFDKDYFLPALKVLERRDGKYFSPQRESEWEDMELVAKCGKSSYFNVIYTLSNNGVFGSEVKENESHNAPHPDCDCGIYGSVNMEEVASYLFEENRISHSLITFGQTKVSKYTNDDYERILCIVEPSEDAEVIVCRKGWKASKAFISEIIGETINHYDANQILSLAWGRNINLGELYENR